MSKKTREFYESLAFVNTTWEIVKEAMDEDIVKRMDEAIDKGNSHSLNSRSGANEPGKISILNRYGKKI